jgi:hypothetical protein
MIIISRPIHHHYQDPLSLIWLTCAAQVGYTVVRTADAYASTDGKRTLFIAEDADLDADDSLAQMILHELCHALVEGESGEAQQDWGLDNTSGRDIWREQACLRLQAYLAGSVGLRDFFAPTTDFRIKFWNQLADDPFIADTPIADAAITETAIANAATTNTAPANAAQNGRHERSCVAARQGAWRASMPRWQQPLQTALAASAAIALAVREAGIAQQQSEALPSLWCVTQTQPVMHPAGHAPFAPYYSDQGCVDCAWSFSARGTLRCQQAPTIKLSVDTQACTRWEPAGELNCQTCGACCRQAFDSVEVGQRERVVKLYPDLIIHAGTRLKLKRAGERCAALASGNDHDNTYHCALYDQRPRTCRDFTRGSNNCWQARRKVGLSI